MEWLLPAVNWYIYVLVLGLICYPLTKKLFWRFFDEGYAFSKTIAIIILSYATFIVGILKIAPFTQAELFVLTAILFLLNIIISIKGTDLSIQRQHKTSTVFPAFLTKNRLFIIIFEEILFLIAFLFLAYVRGQEPSIHGLEKFMDFGFMNSILKSRFFPPLDMWYSGYPINYYYFGHLSGAFLIKLTGTIPFIGYNLILATIFAQAIITAFSLSGNIIYCTRRYVLKNLSQHSFSIITYGLLGSLIMNFGGNLHTIYLFTSGYPNESPVPFWQILGGFNPAKYWYPNATRFIPFTIHEFPSYSYVVADLHGHVFDIPFVLLTLAILFIFFLRVHLKKIQKNIITKPQERIFTNREDMISVVIIGFLAAIHYMTNAFDGPIYILLSLILLFVLFGITKQFIMYAAALIVSFVVASLPFSLHFTPFVSGIGLNCSPAFLVKLQKVGPFLFEQGKCQSSPLWMMGVLWGFFWINLIILLIIFLLDHGKKKTVFNHIDQFLLIIFLFGTYLIVVPEFFYIKDIYPDHFRANTMFKLGYQAFMMMSIAAVYVMYRVRTMEKFIKYGLKLLLVIPTFLILLYPFYSFPSYYGDLKKPAELDGSLWLQSIYPEAKEIVNFINTNIQGQPIILEAQGDSYTDYDVISAYTGLPTVAGWWVHEWLWRGSSDVVGSRIPDITAIYESSDIPTTRNLLKKYNVKYVVVTTQERTKYKQIYEPKFSLIGKKVFESSNKLGALYKVD